MRAAFVLALLLSLATPPGQWLAGDNASSHQGGAATMSAPAGALCQLVRDTGKSEKTFSGGWCAAIERASSPSLPVNPDRRRAHASPLPALALDCPPLAPRPPPFDLLRS
jgi:hypothetical protein